MNAQKWQIESGLFRITVTAESKNGVYSEDVTVELISGVVDHNCFGVARHALEQHQPFVLLGALGTPVHPIGKSSEVQALENRFQLNAKRLLRRVSPEIRTKILTLDKINGIKLLRQECAMDLRSAWLTYEAIQDEADKLP